MGAQEDSGKGRIIGFFLGPIVFLTMILMSAPDGMNPSAWKVAAVTALMAIWWISEAIPIPATALMPIALFPLLGVMKSKAACAPYSNHLIYLFMGGFFLAVTMERWNLHRRIAIHTIKAVGTSPGRMILGFMIATGFLSMWVSNTATAMMMVPIGLAVIQQATGFDSQTLRACPSSGPESNFGKCLMLGIAYSASMGGVGTIIGTPPNTVMVGMVDKMYGVQIGFGEWMLYGVPLAVVMIAVSWWILTQILFPTKGMELAGGEAIIDQELEKLGPMSKEEKYIVIVGCFIAAFWLSRGFLKKAAFMQDLWPNFGFVHDATIGILGSLILFAIPTNFKKGEFLLDWKTAVKIPWDVILLFGGGLAIANGFAKTGLASFIASRLTMLEGMSLLAFVAVVVVITIFLTEITSNTATATLLVPIMGSAAIAMGVHPFATIVGACVAASFAFMLPVATPPNAVIFGSGCISIKQMAAAGFWLNIFGAFLITFSVVYALPILWGIDLHVLPAWAVMPN
ncbi:solute carrier family 13 (sodium-dependent dicarboxylate transporter), member 2/3/5 [Maridesulfovibrio ferrireducens]|uniref:Solute carrier family 13 (Sodium-dependent dicarboxylate transporter), member 2/3/5 n=1 Tax=Maridesulfovibrio ferrireducens TaxID=246191 RepID=A0A1G9G5X8_9BACT|nr:DASS family sodium-coupled anion symporter [Maridesulfovibrio ferrireducens]SDK96148.1 solute carrier family 13 (sodium-dependent dicarboxylate transporter), member 2/3/5 [Maridesulfovibrio ferrireducens]